MIAGILFILSSLRSHTLRVAFATGTDGYFRVKLVYAGARNMKRLLHEPCVKVSKSEAKKLDDKDLAKLQKRYRAILTRDAKE